MVSCSSSASRSPSRRSLGICAATRGHRLSAGGRFPAITSTDALHLTAAKRPPALRRWPRVAAHIPSDRRLGDLEAELEQLTMNTRRAPKCVRTAHLANERAQISRDLRSANTIAGSPAPKRPKPSTVPANDGLRPDNRNRLKDGRK